MRGERWLTAFLSAAPTGSSPHAWGTPAWSKRRRFNQRFIPTCVGNAPIITDWFYLEILPEKFLPIFSSKLRHPIIRLKTVSEL